jgi:hypothetical protein
VNLSSLFQAAKNMILPTPAAELPLIRHPEMEGNGDLQFWSDLKYLHELRSDILDEIRAGAFVWEVPVPVEGQQFWQDFGDWPLDEAAFLIDAWKVARLGEAA